ncbi:hypothetical protein BH23CHL4_BH23CHL4_28180 [soil metagenome]
MRKHLTLLAAFVLAAGFLIGIAATNAVASIQDTSETTSLEGVASISIDGIGTVAITIGSPAGLVITGPSAAIEQLDVLVEDDELEIEPAEGANITLGESEELRFEITVASLEDIRLRGAVRLEASGLSGNELDVRLDGATTAVIADVQVSEFDAELRGASLLTVTGSTTTLDVDVREASTFDGTLLVAGTADVEARDAATARVNVTGSLEADARAASIIEYSGDPSDTDFSIQDAAAIRPFTGTPVAGTPTAGASPAAVEDDQPSGNEVGMAGRAFAPATLQITVGDTVTWTNDDDSDHTVTASDGLFDSGQLGEGATFSFTFDTAGEFTYFCAIHPEMQGTIVVVE